MYCYSFQNTITKQCLHLYKRLDSSRLNYSKRSFLFSRHFTLFDFPVRRHPTFPPYHIIISWSFNGDAAFLRSHLVLRHSAGSYGVVAESLAAEVRSLMLWLTETAPFLSPLPSAGGGGFQYCGRGGIKYARFLITSSCSAVDLRRCN